MTKKNVVAIAIIAFVAGCMGGPAVESLIVRPLSAQQAADGVQRWEYQCVAARGNRGPATFQYMQDDANQMGAEGWEMVGPVSLGVCYKRPR